MKYLEIVKIPEGVLRKKSKVIQLPLTKEIKELIPVMKESMKRANGVGLAAPQVGIAIRLIIVSTKDGPLACINPCIIKKSWIKEWMEEGCLSVPEKWGSVKRNRSVDVKFISENNEEIAIHATGLLAQIFQHEIDHINGTLFIDKAKGLSDRS